MKRFAYIDFERSMKGDFYLVGIQIDGRAFKQTVLTEGLRGYAKHHNLRLKKPEEVAESLCNFCRENKITIAAYSEAEKKALQKLTCCKGLKYLNLNVAAKKWRKRYKRADFANLPHLSAQKKMPRAIRRELDHSLYSVSRLISDSQLDGFAIPKWTAYGHRRTSPRFRTVIDALHLHHQVYKELTPTQKAKGTKALNHNRFDVQVLPRLHSEINLSDSRIVSASTSNLNE